MIKKTLILFFLSIIAALPARAQNDLPNGMYAQMQTNKGLIII
jgi:hypothetical protein